MVHLDDTIRLYLSDSELNADEIALAVANDLNPKDLRDVLVMVLPARIREIAKRQRNEAFDAVYNAPAPKLTQKTKGRSKWEREVEVLALLNSRVNIDRSSQKFLRDCTIEDLQHVATFRRDLAARQVATAEMYERLADVMRTNKAGVLAQLDDATILNAVRGPVALGAVA